MYLQHMHLVLLIPNTYFHLLSVLDLQQQNKGTFLAVFSVIIQHQL